MIKIKKAFSLSELLIALTMVIVATVLMASALKTKMPNMDRAKVRLAYSQILKITQNLLNDPAIYATANFSDTSQYKDPTTGEVFVGNTKFINLFQSRLNAAESVDVSSTNPKISSSTVPTCCLSLINTENCNRTNSATYLACFKTAKNVTYCIPKNTNISRCFVSNGYVVIKVYINGNYDDKGGYYFAIDKTGKVSVLPITKAFKGKSANFCSLNDTKTGKPNYNVYNHCKTNDYLLYSKPID